MPKFGFNKFAKATLLKSNFGMGVRSRAYLLHIYETCFPNNTSGGLFLTISYLSLDFPVTHFILPHPLDTSEKLKFLDVFREYRKKNSGMKWVKKSTYNAHSFSNDNKQVFINGFLVLFGFFRIYTFLISMSQVIEGLV